MNSPDPLVNAAGNSAASLNNAKSAGSSCVSCATTKDNAFRAFQSALRANEELKKFESVAAEGVMLRQKHSEHLVYIEQLSSESQQKSDKICSLENENAEAKLKVAMLEKRNRDLIESAKDSQKHQKAANDLRRKLDDSLEALEQVHLKRVDFRTRFIDSVTGLKSQLKANIELKKMNDRLKDQVATCKQSNISMKNGSKRYNKLVNELAKLLRANDVEIPRKLQDEMYVLSHDGDGKQMTSANGDVSVLDDSDDDLADNVESQFLFLQASSGGDAGTSGSGTNTCPSYVAPLPTVSDDDEGIETHVREKKERVGAVERKQQRTRNDVLVQSHSRSDDDHTFSQSQQGKSQPLHQRRKSPQKKKTGRSYEKNVPVLPPITLEQASDGRGRNRFIDASRTSVPVPAASPARIDDPEMRQQSSSITGKRGMSVKQQQLEMMKNTNVKDFAARLREAEAAGNGQRSKAFVRNKVANATKPTEKPAMNIPAESSSDHACVHSSGGRDLPLSDDNEVASYSSSLDDSEMARKKQEKADEELARRIQEEVYQQPRRSSRSRTYATPARKSPAGSSRTRTQEVQGLVRKPAVSCKKTMSSQRDIDIGPDQQTCESVSEERITDVQSVEVEGASEGDVGEVLLNMLDQVCGAVDTDVSLNCTIANESVVRSSESCDAGCPGPANPVIPVAALSARNLFFEMPTRAFKKPVQTPAQRQKPVSYSDDFMLDLLSGASTFTPSGQSRPILGSQQTSCKVDVVDQDTLCTTNAVEDGLNELPDALGHRAVVDAVNPVKCIGQDVDLLSQGSGLISPGKSRVDQLKQQDRIERSPSKTPRESMLQDDLLMSDSEDDGDDDLRMETNVPVVNDGLETKSSVRNTDMDREKAVCELESGIHVTMEKVRVHSSQEVAPDETVATEDGVISEKITESSTQIGVLPISTDPVQEKDESLSLNEISIASIEKTSQVADSSLSSSAKNDDHTLQSPRMSLDQTLDLDPSTLLPKSSAKRRSPSEGTTSTRRSLTTRACKQRQEDATTTVKMAKTTPIVTCPGANSSTVEDSGQRSRIRTSMKAPTRKSEVVQKRDEMNVTSPEHLEEHEDEEEQLEMTSSSRVSRVSRALASPATSTRSKTSVQSPSCSDQEVKSSLASSAVLNDVSVKKGRGRTKKSVTDFPAMSLAIKKSTESSSSIGVRKMPARAAKSPARAEQSLRRVSQKESDDELLIDVAGDSSPDQVFADEPSTSKSPTRLPACPRVSMAKKNPLSRTADVGKMMKKNLQQKKAPVSVAKAVSAPASRKSLSRKSVGATQTQIPSASLSAEAVPATLNRRKRAMAHDVVPVGPNVKKSKATDASLLFEVLRQVVKGGMDSSEAQQKLNECDHLASLDESEVVSALIDSMAEAVGDQWFLFGKNMEHNQPYIIPVNEQQLTHVIDILTDTWTSLMKSVVTGLSHRMISSAEQNACLFARMTRLIVTLARNCDAQDQDECLREVECVMKHTVERREPIVVVQMLSFACCAWNQSVKWVREVIAGEVDDPRSKHLHRLLRLHAAVVPTDWKKFSKSCEISAAMNEGACVVPANSNEANDWWDEMISNVTRLVDRGDAIQLPIADEIKLSTEVREYMSMALALYSRFTTVLGQSGCSQILDSLRSAMKNAFEIVDLATFSVDRPRITGGSLDFDRGENVVPDQKKAIHAAIMMMIGSEVFANGIIDSPNRIRTPHLRAMLEDALPLCVRAKESGHKVLMVLEWAMREWVTTMQHATKFSLTAAIGKSQFLQ